MAQNLQSVGQRAKILDEIADKLAEHKSETEIAREIGPRYNLSDEAARALIKGLWAEWQTNPPLDYDAKRQQLRLSFARLYREAMDNQSYSAALGALERLGKLDGLFAPAKTQIDVRGSNAVSEIAPERIRDRMREIIAKRPELAEILLPVIKKEESN